MVPPRLKSHRELFFLACLQEFSACEADVCMFSRIRLVIREHQVYLQVVKDGFPDDTNDRSSFNVKRQKYCQPSFSFIA